MKAVLYEFMEKPYNYGEYTLIATHTIAEESENKIFATANAFEWGNRFDRSKKFRFADDEMDIQFSLWQMEKGYCYC